MLVTNIEPIISKMVTMYKSGRTRIEMIKYLREEIDTSIKLYSVITYIEKINGKLYGELQKFMIYDQYISFIGLGTAKNIVDLWIEKLRIEYGDRNLNNRF